MLCRISFMFIIIFVCQYLIDPQFTAQPVENYPSIASFPCLRLVKFVALENTGFSINE
ncbi:MAG: hypothetical protein SH857_18215 [Chitinophagales bacterium]|nr:hypothetical protein [Chitinophagales bacterium]